MQNGVLILKHTHRFSINKYLIAGLHYISFLTNVSPMSDEEIIEGIIAGANHVLERVYVQFRDEFVLWIIKHYDCNVEDAKELYQLSVLIFYENIASGRITMLKSSIKTYLFAVGKNKFLEWRKAGKKFTGEINYYLEDRGEEEKEEKENKELQLELLEAGMNQLGDACKNILRLFYFLKKSMDEITGILGYKNADTVKNQKYKCMQRLKKIYRDIEQKSVMK